MKLLEFYQEEPGGTFIHDGTEYWLNPLLSLSRNFDIIDIPVSELSWILHYVDDLDISDYKDIDISKPILIAKYQDKFAVIDGIHRLAKSVYLDKKTIPARYIDDVLLSYTEVDK